MSERLERPEWKRAKEEHDNIFCISEVAKVITLSDCPERIRHRREMTKSLALHSIKHQIELFNRVINALKNQKYTAVKPEYKVANPELRVYGRIDLLLETSDGLTILEHKTSRDYTAKDVAQLLIYMDSIILSKRNQSLIGKLTNSSHDDLNFSVHDLEMIAPVLYPAMLEAIVALRERLRIPGNHCKWCNEKNECECSYFRVSVYQ